MPAVCKFNLKEILIFIFSVKHLLLLRCLGR